MAGMSRGAATGAGATAIVMMALAACSARPAPRAPMVSEDDGTHSTSRAPSPAPSPAPPPADAPPPTKPPTGIAIGHGGGVGIRRPIDVGVQPEGVPAPAEVIPLDDGLGGAVPVRGYDAPGYVAFTFDDGPHPAWTPRVLAALAAHDVHGTFFIVGRNVWGLDHPARRRELGAIAAAGHDIGNHTWSHARLTEVGPVERAREVDQTGAVIRWITGRPVTTVRPPYGASSPELTRLLRSRGLTEIGWNIDPRDWQARSPVELRRLTVAKILRAEGGIVLLHDDKWITATALPGILADLERANCARIGAGRPPILPVSLHYFIQRQVPAWVEARTRSYREALVARCRPLPAPLAVTDPVVDNHTLAH